MWLKIQEERIKWMMITFIDSLKIACETEKWFNVLFLEKGYKNYDKYKKEYYI